MYSTNSCEPFKINKANLRLDITRSLDVQQSEQTTILVPVPVWCQRWIWATKQYNIYCCVYIDFSNFPVMIFSVWQRCFLILHQIQNILLLIRSCVSDNQINVSGSSVQLDRKWQKQCYTIEPAFPRNTPTHFSRKLNILYMLICF